MYVGIDVLNDFSHNINIYQITYANPSDLLEIPFSISAQQTDIRFLNYEKTTKTPGDTNKS